MIKERSLGVKAPGESQDRAPVEAPGEFERGWRNTPTELCGNEGIQTFLLCLGTCLVEP